MENSILVSRLADERTVRRDEKLDQRETSLQPETDLALPGWMEMRVDLVDEHDAGVRHDQACFVRFNEILVAVDLIHVAKNVDHQGQGGSISFAHIRQR